MAKEFIGEGTAKVPFSRGGKVFQVGEKGPCTQYEIDKGYFEKATVKVAKKKVEAKENKAIESVQTKGSKGKKG